MMENYLIKRFFYNLSLSAHYVRHYSLTWTIFNKSVSALYWRPTVDTQFIVSVVVYTDLTSGF